MQAVSIIQVGGKEVQALTMELEDAGYDPLVRDSIESVLETLRYEQVGGLLISNMNVGLDIVELVLSVRDVDSQLPVGVVATKRGGRDLEALQLTLSGIYALKTGAKPSELVAEFDKAVQRGLHHDRQRVSLK
jgi:DNA-binding response OmpR family regulator